MLNPSFVLGPLAAGMVLVTAYLVRWAAEARTPLRAGVVVFLLLMMGAMFGGAAIYFSAPSAARLLEGFWAASAVMSVSAFAVFAGHAAEVRARLERGPDAPAPKLVRLDRFVAAVVVLVLANELLMGWTFSIAAGTPVATAGTGLAALGSLAVGTVNSPWFLFTMASEMVLTALLLRSLLPRSLFVFALVQGGIMFLSPVALASSAWVDLAVGASSALMIVLFVYAMEFLYRHRQLPRAFASYTVVLFAIYGLMMAGLFVWQISGDGALFALSVIAEMVLFYEAVVRPERVRDSAPLVWQLNARWAFEVLAGIFVAELFMGAVLDVQVEPGVYLGAFSLLPLAGAPMTVLTNALSNGFWFIATVTGSTWFLLMMGVEMGALVAFKWRETRSRETRIRLGLMLGCYGAFTVFYPSLYYGLVLPNAPSGTSVPVIGWSMGIGSAPLAVGVFGVLLVSYAAMGVLTFLFGRRVVCSTFCSAPLMYQGTTIDAMSSFNRSSPVARKYLSSRFSNAYTATTGLVMGSLAVASVVSYLNTTGATNWYVEGTVDPTVFLFTLYFSVLWYLMFVTIPYTGNYNCVTMGWCYTGTIAQAFQKLGPYKLKVRDRAVCRACTTLDCAKHCPVGLTDMPGWFRQTGEFRSTKCCGVGDCVEVCPYGNLYIYDIRHWIREKLHLPMPPNRMRAPGAARGSRSVSAPAAPSVAASPAASGAGPVPSSLSR